MFSELSAIGGRMSRGTGPAFGFAHLSDGRFARVDVRRSPDAPSGYRSLDGRGDFGYHARDS